MMTSNPLALALSLVGGIVAGALFFGGLWLTVQHLATSRHPVALVSFSFLIRVLLVLGIFFAFGRGHLDRLLICLGGFLIARFIVTRMTGKFPPPSVDRKEVSHASES